MFVKRIYNNNVVLATDENFNDVILIGKGIAFGLSRGSRIDESLIDKKFVFSDDVRGKFLQLVQDIPSDILVLTDNIVSEIKKEISVPLNDKLYITLSDHINSMIERIQMGVQFDMAVLWNIKNLYPNEYGIGLKIVDLLRRELDIRIEDDEASFIALHIINAQLDSDMNQIYKITSLVGGISDIAEETLKDINKDSFAYNRFIVHCQLFISSVIKNNGDRATESEGIFRNQNIELYNILVDKYPPQELCLNKISDFIANKMNHDISIDEKLYLLVHLIKLTSSRK